MKNIFSILLIPVFLIATTIGVASNAFYCKDMGKVIEKACCDDVDKDGCCNSKPELKKINDDFFKAQSDIQLFKAIQITESFVFYPLIIISDDYSFYSGSSPPAPKEGLYIVNCSLII
ncbi:MAG TPA: hypothetical protein VIK89_04720 [Cytophagaceae bacterium]